MGPVHGVHQDGKMGQGGGDLPGGGQAVHDRHRQIHNDEVGTVLERPRYGGLPIFCIDDSPDGSAP